MIASRLTTLSSLLCGVLACGSLFDSSTTPDISVKRVGRCPLGQLPCGNGCMPSSAVCCDDGTRHTSSYCTNSAGGGCRPSSTSACKTPSPGSPAANFCCAPNTDEGSFDCPDGQHHCGLSCKPIAEPCCADSQSNDECPAAADLQTNGATCQPADGTMCGYVAGACVSCPPGSCCAGTGSGYRCLTPTGVCAGISLGGKPPPTSNSCRIVWDCGTSSQCATVYGSKTGSAAEPDLATCQRVCASQGACTCQGC